MYQSVSASQAPLGPCSYRDEYSHTKEIEAIFRGTWQLVGLRSSLPSHGQYLSIRIGDVPLLVRNFHGQLVALRNVCAHRHCQLVTSDAGFSDRLKCPFHGWEFGADGRTRKIPGAKNFPDLNRDQYRLTSFPIQFCGDLIFVRLCQEGPSLQEWLADLYSKIEIWTGTPEWKPSPGRSLSLPANWKIPVEISLESYHIPEVHPQSFAKDPGEEHSTHLFGKYSSSFLTSFSANRLSDRVLQTVERAVLRILGAGVGGLYEHHHIFPNLLISHTDSLTLIQVIRPCTTISSVTNFWQFGRRSSRRNPVSLLTGWVWAKLTGWLTQQVLKEDIRMFFRIQNGTNAAVEHAVLGRCEERILFFQDYIRRVCSTHSIPLPVMSSEDGAGSMNGMPSCVIPPREEF